MRGEHSFARRHSCALGFVLAILLASLMAACGDGGGSSPPSSVSMAGQTTVVDVARSPALSSGQGNLRVMNYNAYQGTDFTEVQQAANAEQFLAAVGQVITQVRATRPPERMQALARQILDAAPDLATIEELTQWSTGSFDAATGRCATPSLEFDMEQALLNALAAQGGHYTVAVEKVQFSIPPTPGFIPPAQLFCGQMISKLVLLARTDLKDKRFTWTNAQSGTYAASLQVPTPSGDLLPFARGWVSLDASFNGRTFRYIGTHLESGDDPGLRALRYAQAFELILGPARTDLPTVIAMDANAQAAPAPLDPAYSEFISAGFADAWATVAPADPGYTCCQSQLLDNPVSQLSQRIDLILTRGPIRALNVALFGNDPASRTASGLWASDHAGLAAQLLIQEPPSRRGK